MPVFSDDVAGNKDVGTNKEVAEGHREANDVAKGNKVVIKGHTEAKDVAKGNKVVAEGHMTAKVVTEVHK